MKIEEINTHLTTLKLYMNKLESWIKQANQLIYEVEERLMDIEDEIMFNKYYNKSKVNNLKDAATEMFCPPRLVNDHCINEYILHIPLMQEILGNQVSKFKGVNHE
ncbi:MAG: hypothetical protein ABFD00_10530 [Chloroherpetonaceae bacterium]